MKDYEFRAKSIDNNEWVYGFLIKGKNSYILTQKQFEDAVVTRAYKERHLATFCHQVIPETVGQNTGLCDKNDVEIYENDIVRCLNAYGEDYYISSIVYNGGAYSVDVWGCDYDYTALGWALGNNDINEIEVIGNTTDNLELLERKSI